MAEIINKASKAPKTGDKRPAEPTDHAKDAETAHDPTEVEDNPWTDREDLEFLLIHDAYNNFSAEEKAEKLHAKMSRVRSTHYQPEKPQREAHEIKSHIRELKTSGVTIELLTDRVYPKAEKEPPRKKKKTAVAESSSSAKGTGKGTTGKKG